MITYTARFKKKNGDMRDMFFTKLKDLPEKFKDSKISGDGDSKTYQKGMELVWDLEENNFRVFNWKTIVGKPYIEEASASILGN